MNQKSNKGFSLVELLVAIAVMSIILVMVVQMMGSSSVALRKTKKKLELQTEAMEFREQFSDIVMQATYIRVLTKDKKLYTFDTELSDKNRRKRDVADDGTINGTLVTDSYPDYTNPANRKLDIYMNQNDYTLFGRDKAGDYPSTIGPEQSFRILTDGTTSGKPHYIIPAYIYVRYQPTLDADRAVVAEEYAIYKFTDDKKVYVAKGTITNAKTLVGDGFATAKTSVDGASGYNGLMSDKVNDVYFSADVDANTVYIDIQFENAKYINQTYEYRDSIVLRNTYTLTVPPNKMYMYTP